MFPPRVITKTAVPAPLELSDTCADGPLTLMFAGKISATLLLALLLLLVVVVVVTVVVVGVTVVVVGVTVVVVC